jgi:uncharacterized protein YneF (UPF0154 family)
MLTIAIGLLCLTVGVVIGKSWAYGVANRMLKGLLDDMKNINNQNRKES